VKLEKKPCLNEMIEVVRGPEESRFALTKCDGSAAPLALEQLSILARAGSAAKPTEPVSALAKSTGTQIAPGIKRVDPGLLSRLQTIVTHFAKGSQHAKVAVISGYRPKSEGSYHASAKALDFRIEGVRNEEVVAFCKTLVDTGCGYYPNSSFVHVDVRPVGTGHVSWIDASGPGESPRYVASWPPPNVAAPESNEESLTPLPAGDTDSGDEPPVDIRPQQPSTPIEQSTPVMMIPPPATPVSDAPASDTANSQKPE